MPNTARHRLLPLVLGSSLSLALGACGNQEVEDLKQIQRRLDLELAERSEIAQNLNERRRERDVLQERTAPICLPGTASELLSFLGSRVPGAQVSVREQREEKVWLLVKGQGPASGAADVVTSLARQASSLSLEEVSAQQGSWSLVLRSDGTCPPLRAWGRPAYKKPVMPPAGWVGTRESVRLRESIAQTHQRIAELEKVLGEIANVNSEKDWAEKILAVHDRRQDTLARQAPLVALLFQAPSPSSSTLRLTRGEAVYAGGLPLDGEPWRARLVQAGFQARRDEGSRWVLTRP